MFNHDHAVAFITQLLQEFIQAVYVARVHSDAGFVKDVQYIHKAGRKERYIAMISSSRNSPSSTEASIHDF
jgi:hypothetical protein